MAGLLRVKKNAQRHTNIHAHTTRDQSRNKTNQQKSTTDFPNDVEYIYITLLKAFKSPVTILSG